MGQLLTLLLTLTLAAAGQDLLSRGQRAFQAGDYAAAEAAFEEHLKLHPNSAEALSNLAVVASRREDFPRAITLYRKALAANPKLTQIWFNLGVAQLRSAAWTDAAASFRTFLESYPKESRAHELLGLCLVESGQYQAAIAELEAAGTSSSSAFSLAYAYARSGDTEKGAALLANLDSFPAQARLIEGLIEQRRERFVEARAKFEEAVRLDPRSAPAATALGRLLLQQREDDPAIAQLRRAIELAPHDAESHYLLGVALERGAQTAEATRLFERASTLRANFPGPLYALAKIDLREGRAAAAVKKLEQAARYLPDAEAIQVQLAKAYQAAGDSAKAKASVARVRELQQARLRKQQADLEAEVVLEP